MGANFPRRSANARRKPAKLFSIAILFMLLLTSCGVTRMQPIGTLSPYVTTSTHYPGPFVTPTPLPTLPPRTPEGEQAATLHSLQKIDDYPLYTIHYYGSYGAMARSGPSAKLSGPMAISSTKSCQPMWGCSLFAAMGDEKERLFGRNFDWEFSPALLLFTDPKDGYASVSMVDISYLGFDGERSKTLMDLNLDQRRALLEAPSLPFDGMNEKGLAVGMSAVDAQRMPDDPQKQTIGELGVIREMLDHAATVDEAIRILDQYNIDMRDVPIHYLIASASGESAVVEFYEGQMRVFRNQGPWQVSTNFLLAAAGDDPQGWCWRYDLLQKRLRMEGGRISPGTGLELLQEVAQDNTQWSILYHLNDHRLEVVMGRGFEAEAHTFQMEW